MEKKKITIIDILIIFAIIAAGIVVALVMIPNGKNKSKGEVEFVVLASDISNDVVDKIQPGETAIVSYSNETEAKVSDVFVTPYKVNIFDHETKTFKSQESELKSDVYITLRLEADVSDTLIKKDDLLIRVGNEIDVDAKNLAVIGHIVEIKDERKN